MQTTPTPQLPITPMLAKAAKKIPMGDYAYEPKWDGFRCLIATGDYAGAPNGAAAEPQLWSRAGKSLNRYFPEVVEAARQLPPGIIDGELVVRAEHGASGTRLDWDSLSARIHPAASRVALLAEQTPAEFIAFDLLAAGGQALCESPFRNRRARLEELDLGSFHLTRYTLDPVQAQTWFETFEGAGLDGIVAKPLEGTYLPGKRELIKVKHARTAEAVLVGYRVHKSGNGVGSLLLGLYDDSGQLRNVGGIAAFTAARRLELIDELAPLVVRGDDGGVAHAETDRNRFSRDTSFVPLRPERVVEVAFDQLEGNRFRHSVQFLRWRPDREASSCLLEQVERAPAYDLDAVLSRVSTPRRS